MFTLDPAFEEGSEPIADLKLCAVRLQRDARYPWLVMIPRVSAARELEDLAADDRTRLMEEIVFVGRVVRAVGEALGRPVFKLNFGALGNITSQLHVHIVGRRVDDAVWPRPVWGIGEALDYPVDQLEVARLSALTALKYGFDTAAL